MNEITQAEVVEEPLEITILETENLDNLPEMLKLWEEISHTPIDFPLTRKLRQLYYSNFSDEEIILIEHTMDYDFKKFQLYASWARFSDTKQPCLEDYGLDSQYPLSERLEVIKAVNAATELNAAFATLDQVENFLMIPDQPSIVESVARLIAKNGSCSVVDIGCGGQAADIQLLTHNLFLEKKLNILGVGAYDYGEKLRPGFPEILEKLEFTSQNIYRLNNSESADLVISVRTLPYTGVVDVARFFDSAMALCKPEGNIWIECIDEYCFDFTGSVFDNFQHYLESIKEEMPSLKYRYNGTTYSVFWKKSEGSPLTNLFAKTIVLNVRQRPHLIRYGVS